MQERILIFFLVLKNTERDAGILVKFERAPPGPAARGISENKNLKNHMDFIIILNR